MKNDFQRWAMLQIYFDDSGTHSGSDVVVWGGVAGYSVYHSILQQAWLERLKNPCDGKPPIKKFSSHDLMHGINEFDGYNNAERDLTRRNFRKLIIDAGISVMSYGISAVDWHELADRNMMAALRSPETTVLGLAIKGGCLLSKAENESLAFVFDQGCVSRASIPWAFDRAVQAAEIDPTRVSYSVSPVLGNAGLQAADLVAHETYQMFCQYRLSGEVSPTLHLKRLRDGAHDFQAAWIGRQEIENALKKTNKILFSGTLGA